MAKIGALLAATLLLGFGVAHTHAQDIAGIEDCTKTSGLDKRTGCFQSNIDFLNRQTAKSSAELQQKLSTANAEIGELKRTIAALQKSLGDLQAKLTTMQTSLDELQKSAKKPDAKESK
jgi:septal ring factor EnvC (AmiA/AmiB activator)